MKASIAMPVIAFVVLGLATSAYAHSVERVRRELRSDGYDQLEFKRTKFPVWVDACRDGERYHLHVDWYGKIRKKTRTGSCPSEESPGATAVSPTKGAAANENSTISGAPLATDKAVKETSVETVAEPQGEPAISKDVDCKKFFPAIGETLTVPCE